MNPFMLIFLILQLILTPNFIHCQSSPPAPDMSVTISKKGFDYLFNEIETILNRQLPNLKLQNASQQIDDGLVELHDVTLTKYVPPTYFYSLESPHTLTWGLNDASMRVNGQWSGKKKLILPYVKGGGTFELQIDQLNFIVKAQLGRNSSNGLTTIDNFQCNTTIGNLTAHTGGGVMGYVLEVFRGTVESKVKPLLEQALCTKMENLIEQDLDRDLLQKLPTQYEVGRKNFLTLALINAPTVDGKTGYVQLDHQVGVMYDGKDESSKYSSSANRVTSTGLTSPLTGPLDRMIYIRMSEKPANMLLYTMHTKNMTTFIIDEHSSQQASDFLRLDCASGDKCLGQSFPGINTIYPSGAKGAFRVYTSKEPQIRFNNASADLKFPAVMEITARSGPPKYSEDTLLTADVNVEATVHFTLDNSGKKLMGDWNVYTFDVTARPGGLTQLVKVDNKKLGDSLKGFVVEQGSKQLTSGIDVPVASTFVPGYQLTGVTLKTLPQIMQFEGDMAVQKAFVT